MSKIEQCIDDLESYLDSCKARAFSNNKQIVVDRDELDEILSDLRYSIPDEIRKYQRIVSNQEAILNHAREQANSTIKEAQDVAKDQVLKAKAQAASMVEENIITQKAYKRAEAILAEAQAEAQKMVDVAAAESDSLRTKAVSYADDVLGSLQQVIQLSVNEFGARYEQLTNSLNNSFNIIANDRKQLAPENIYTTTEQSIPASEMDADDKFIADLEKNGNNFDL